MQETIKVRPIVRLEVEVVNEIGRIGGTVSKGVAILVKEALDHRRRATQAEEE